MCRWGTLAAILLFSLASRAQDTRLVLLGTGNPNPDPDRMGPATAILTGNRAYIVDCGPGVVRRAAQAGIQMEQLTRLFVTHLHSDHTVGLPDFVFTPAVTGRKDPLEIYGPPGTRSMTAHVMKAWREDMQIRLHGLEPAVARAYEVHAHDAAPGEIYRDDAVRVTAIAVDHGSWKHAYAYRFEVRDKTIVISGDTTYSPRLAAAAKGCDILLHEVYSEAGLAKRTADWQRYHRAFHTSAPDVGRIASAVNPRVLVLYHQLAMGESAEEVVSEVRRAFTGTVVYGKDLDVIR